MYVCTYYIYIYIIYRERESARIPPFASGADPALALGADRPRLAEASAAR